VKWSLRILVSVVGGVVLASFVIASYSLKVTLDERDRRITENAAQIAANTRRQMRNCERIAVIVRYLDRLVPTVRVTEELDEINRRYPDVKPCTIQR